MEQPEVLESWKDISAYLKRSVATCQRWEIELGLPIHRLDGTPKARVFAYKEELDNWMAQKLHSSDRALDTSDERHRLKRAKRVAAASAVIVLAVIATLFWRLVVRKPFPPQSPEKVGQAISAEPGRIAKERDIDLGSITSRSPEALKSYMEGCRILMGPRDLELWRSARSHFQKAIEIDPDFAMAYSALASTFGSQEEQTKNLSKALELCNRVSLRERLMIQGHYDVAVDNNPGKAIQAYKRSLRIYPGDEMLNDKIASLYARIYDYKNAYKHREYLYERDRTSRFQVQYFVGACRSLGLYDKGTEAFQYYLSHAPEDHEMRKRLYNWYWQYCGEYGKALDEADRLRAAGADRDVERIFPLYLMGNYAATEQLCKDLIGRGQDREKSVSAARDWYAGLYMTLGQFEKAKEQIVLGLREEEELVKAGKVKECYGLCFLHGTLARIHEIEKNWESALAETQKIWQIGVDFKTDSFELGVLITKATIYAEMELFDKAPEMAEDVREWIDSYETPRKPSDYLFVSGVIELKKGNLRKAVDLLDKAQSLDLIKPSRVNLVLTDTLASAYEQAGKLRAARKERERIPLLTLARCGAGYLYATNFYRLGRICEELRDRAKAIEYLKKFLDLWKDADPIFREVEDARARLSRLESH